MEGAEHRKAFISIPAYTSDRNGGREGVLRRQCTREFKVEVINQEVRRQLGLKKGERAAGKFRALGLIGISTDEVTRMKDSRISWIRHIWPLIDAGISRQRCLAIMSELGFPKPTRSSCWFCPYHDNHFWAWIKKTRPDEFGKAVRFDAAIRNMTKAGVERPVFLHRSCRPLDEVDFKTGGDPNQLTLFNEDFQNECEGLCGV